MTSEVIKTIPTESADQFLDVLQIRRPEWLHEGALTSPWIFRGQADAEWGLVPSAYRANSEGILDRYKHRIMREVENIISSGSQTIHSGEPIPPLEISSSALAQLGAEMNAVQDFIEVADRVGHPIPVEGKMRLDGPKYGLTVLKEHWESYLHNAVPHLNYGFDPIDFSLAQHHRIPTRLLDWTHSSFIAAYFAAEDAFLWDTGPRPRVDQKPTHMAVWALHKDVAPDNDDHSSDFRLRALALERSKIPYMGAQSGLFIYDRGAFDTYLNGGRWIGLEEVVAKSDDIGDNVIKKVTVPASEAADVLRMLAVEGVTRAALMPSLDTVSQTQHLKLLLEDFFGGLQ